MHIPNPRTPNDEWLDELIIERIREVEPYFYKNPNPVINYVMDAEMNLTPAQKKEFIRKNRQEAEQPLNKRARSFMGILIRLGAKDLDITNAVDEMLHYLSMADSLDTDEYHFPIKSLVKADTNLMIYNVHPKNCEQFNRFLTFNCTREHDTLYEWQGTLIGCAVKKKAFRTHPDFQWITESPWATDPRFEADVAKIAATS